MLTTYNANIPTDMRTSWSKQFLQPTFPSYWEITYKVLQVIDASYTCEDLDFPVCIRLNPQDVESMFPMSKISSYLTYKYPKNKRTKRLYVIEKR